MRSRNLLTGIVVGVFMGALFSPVVVLAGSLEPSVGPTAPGSQMYTLDAIYDRIAIGPDAFSFKMTTFTEPSSGPTAGTMHTLDEIYALAVLRAPVARTGQTPWMPINPAPPGSDGAYVEGVAWPNPRFTVNSNGFGTVTDKLTGLTWLRKVDCFVQTPWEAALDAVNGLKSGQCGLNDGSRAGDWRLPNARELQSLIDFAYSGPALSNAAGTGKYNGDTFTGGGGPSYWSSTTFAGDADHGLVH